MLGVEPRAVYHLCVIAFTVSTAIIASLQVLDSPPALCICLCIRRYLVLCISR